MPEYITRDDAIDLIFIASEQGRAAKALRSLKERCVDAVEVVRCKDCIFAEKTLRPQMIHCTNFSTLDDYWDVSDEWFCGDGIRVDGEEE